MYSVTVPNPQGGSVTFSQAQPFSLISGPCQIESRELALTTAETLRDICARLGIGFIYKSSFDKANRTSHNSARGVGMEEGLKILEEVRREVGVPVLTDIHDIAHVAPVAEVVDVLQIPAFLCRQTDLVMAAAATGKTVNLKKGQFLAPQDMQNLCAKVEAAGSHNLLLTERGTTFGYGNLVVDMRSFPIMAATGYPVIFDATHSVQMPSGQGTTSGGKREFVEPLARAAAAIGVAGFFMETHPEPDMAFSDGPNMVPLADMECLLATLQELDAVAKQRRYQKIASAA